MVLFIFWELVGLSSYLLIGFWFDQAPPADGICRPPPAALKAFIITRFGDFGFLIGVLILFSRPGPSTSSTAQYRDRRARILGVLTLALILLFCGAVGKSAQFPLHVWLPDAMEGPTPVSALIHAATMVAAGVYLVARSSRCSQRRADGAARWSRCIGGFTALFAATIALTQTDIKRVLAYSTISQLGYMMLGARRAAAIRRRHVPPVHARLLQGAAVPRLRQRDPRHRTRSDMRKMGGLRKSMPITCDHVPDRRALARRASAASPASGARTRSSARPVPTQQLLLFGLALVTAFLTAFYMFRAIFMTFGGTWRRLAASGRTTRQYRGDERIRTSRRWTMMAAAGHSGGAGVFAGLLVHRQGFGRFVTGTSIAGASNHASPTADATSASALALVGHRCWPGLIVRPAASVPARSLAGDSRSARFRSTALLVNKYYIDELYSG